MTNSFWCIVSESLNKNSGSYLNPGIFEGARAQRVLININETVK